MALTILGVILVARGEKIPDDVNTIDELTQPKKKNLGLGWALFSATGFGVMFWLLGIRIVPMMGAAPSVWIIRLTSVVATVLVILAARRSMAMPQRRDTPWILGIGVLDTGAYVFNNFGMKLEQISVVSVLASLYGAVTVALAALILKEPVSRIAVDGDRFHFCRHRPHQPLIQGAARFFRRRLRQISTCDCHISRGDGYTFLSIPRNFRATAKLLPG